MFRNIIAKSDLIKIWDMLARSSVNAISFAIGVHRISRGTIARRWELWVQACEPIKSKGSAILVADVLYM